MQSISSLIYLYCRLHLFSLLLSCLMSLASVESPLVFPLLILRVHWRMWYPDRRRWDFVPPVRLLGMTMIRFATLIVTRCKVLVVMVSSLLIVGAGRRARVSSNWTLVGRRISSLSVVVVRSRETRRSLLHPSMLSAMLSAMLVVLRVRRSMSKWRLTTDSSGRSHRG